MSELPCPYCGFNCEIPSNTEEKIECPNCGSIFLYIQNSESHGTIDYRPSPEINDRGRQMSELKATTAQEIVRNEEDCDYMDELFGGVKMPPTQVYLKYEADAVIKELKAQKAQAEYDCVFWKKKYNDCKRELDLLKDTNAFYNGGR